MREIQHSSRDFYHMNLSLGNSASLTTERFARPLTCDIFSDNIFNLLNGHFHAFYHQKENVRIKISIAIC